jgi:fucose permease
MAVHATIVSFIMAWLAERPRTGALQGAAFAGMFVFGMVMALLGAVLPSLSDRLHFDLARAGDLFLFMNAAMLVSGLLTGPLMDRSGHKLPMIWSPALVAAAMAIIAVAGTFVMLLVGVTVLGFGGGALNASANALVADIHADPRKKNAALNLVGIAFGFGALVLPFIVGSLVATVGLTPILFVTTALSALVALFSTPLRFPAARQAGGAWLGGAGRLIRHPMLIALGISLFLQSGNEFIVGGFTAAYLRSVLNLSISTSAYLLAAYWAALMIARLILSRLLLRFSGPGIILLSAIASALAVAALISADSAFTSLAAILFLGCAISAIFPTTLGIAGALFESWSGTAFGLLFAMALAGGMSLPWTVARLASVTDLRTAFWIPVAAFCGIAAIHLVIRGRVGAELRHMAAGRKH